MKVYVFFIFLFLFLARPLPLGAIGIAPTRIELEGVRQENIIQKEFTLSRARVEAREEFVISLQGEGREAISLPRGETMIFNPEERILALPFTLAPARLPQGAYEVTVIVKPKAALSFNVHVQAKIVFSITSETTSQYDFYNITIQDDARDGKPWLHFNVRNAGNTYVPLEYIEFAEVVAKKGAQARKSILREGLPPIPPFSNPYIKLALPDFLPPGVHKVKPVFYNNQDENIVGETKTWQVVIPKKTAPEPPAAVKLSWWQQLTKVLLQFFK